MALPLDDTSSLHITASIGVAIASADDTLNSLLQRADQAMYRAKAQGRNCVVSA
jgi:diguanylate cyclase (GGDEF)-like protein